MVGRTIIVANRIPFNANFSGRKMTLERAVGGLATGLRGIHSSLGSLWVGSFPPDRDLSASRRRRLLKALSDEGVVAVSLDEEEQEGFYESLSNGVIWPLFHSHVDGLPLQIEGWEQYRTVNRRMAEAVVEAYRPGDTVWVHDYQMMLVPRMVRDLVPDARIGFFLHIPFPSPDVVRVFPWCDEVLNGLLGSDLIGFHIPSYLANFVASTRQLLGLETDVDDIIIGDQSVRVGVFPLGVDAEAWSDLGRSEGVRERAATIRDDANGQQLIVGVDRLDYTKGIGRRFLAIDRLLERRPEFRGTVRLIQVSVPSRESVESYASFRRQVDELVGRINGRWGSANWVPVHHIYRSLEDTEIAALYQAAHVMIVSPVRDGMNLVAKEFVATRTDGDGILVLSEFAGAASELAAAFRMNPFDLDGTVDTLAEALTLKKGERRRRMALLRSRVSEKTAAAWADEFLNALYAVPTEPTGVPIGPEELGRQVLEKISSGALLHLVLDYDGTLVPIVATPPEAAPDSELLDVLSKLARRPGVRVDVVSGRSRQDLEAWLGETGVGLFAEHGAWVKTGKTPAWAQIGGAHEGWRPGVERILSYFLGTTPASFEEPKGSSIAWHYRGTDSEPLGPLGFGDLKARELRSTLAEVLAGTPAHALPGNKVVEIVGSGATKGIAAARAAAATDASSIIVAMGDDRTDEDMFKALPKTSFTVKVGNGATRARFRMSGVEAARTFLLAIVQAAADR